MLLLWVAQILTGLLLRTHGGLVRVVAILWARGREAAAIDISLFADRTYALVTLASFVFGIAFSTMFLSSFLFCSAFGSICKA